MAHAVLEIGDEGVHLLVVEAPAVGDLTPLVHEERALRIGAAIDRDGGLTGGTADLVVETVRRLARRARRHAPDRPRTILTGAVADTADEELLGRLTAAIGAIPRRLSPQEDGRLTFVGAAAGVRDPRTPVVLLRLRVEVLQLALGCDGEVLWTADADLGTDRLIRALGAEQRPDGGTTDALPTLVRRRLPPVPVPVRHRSGAWRLVATGAVVRHLAAVITPARRGESLRAVHRVRLGRRELREARGRLYGVGALDGSTVRGLPLSREDEPPLGTRLAVAAGVIAEVADALPVDGVTVSEWGAREAVVLEAIRDGRERETDPGARRRSVRRLAEWMACDLPHAEHVARLAIGLFDGTLELHRLSARDRELLEHAARLHDVGGCVSPNARQRPGTAFLRRATLSGCSDQDLAVLVSLVGPPAGAGPILGYEPYARLGADRRRAVARMTALLRLADGLDLGHDAAVRRVTVQVSDRSVRLALDGAGSLEGPRWAAAGTAPSFERTFDRQLEIVSPRTRPTVGDALVHGRDVRTRR